VAKLIDQEKKLINQFKLFAQGLKADTQKYNWLEKPKPFDGKISNYKNFKQVVQ
jgi:hypothetical protein